MASKNVHVSNNSGNNEWYTPEKFVMAARETMSTIDLDPASSEIANKTVMATKYYTKETNGLDKDWDGNIWMNPPYASKLIKQFVSKLREEVEYKKVKSFVVLVNNATETKWFNELVSISSAVVFTEKRVRFLDPEGNPGAPLQGQAILYFGDNEDGFISNFSTFGWGAKIAR